MRAIVFLADLISFASFGWAMWRHFQRAGSPRLGMVLTGLSVPAFAAVNLAALATRPLTQPVAALLLYAGIMALFWSAIAATRGKRLAACFQRHVPATIVRTGPYRRIRHPFYSSYILTWATGFAATSWWPLAVIAAVMTGVYYCAACQEEKGFLRSPLRDEYRRWMRGTGRFLPSLSGRQ
jgi:protein-S-isoprenylcysteine O-methyltransferase Ste14